MRLSTHRNSFSVRTPRGLRPRAALVIGALLVVPLVASGTGAASACVRWVSPSDGWSWSSHGYAKHRWWVWFVEMPPAPDVDDGSDDGSAPPSPGPTATDPANPNGNPPPANPNGNPPPANPKPAPTKSADVTASFSYVDSGS